MLLLKFRNRDKRLDQTIHTISGSQDDLIYTKRWLLRGHCFQFVDGQYNTMTGQFELKANTTLNKYDFENIDLLTEERMLSHGRI